jgi:hypothetical protein
VPPELAERRCEPSEVFGIACVRDIDVVGGIRRTSGVSSDAADDDEIDVVRDQRSEDRLRLKLSCHACFPGTRDEGQTSTIG